MSLLEIENLSLSIGDTPILRDVELSVAPGEVMGLVGESGSGKSITALTVMRLLPWAARAAGRVVFDGIDILAASEDQMCALRGDDIGMVFQEPMTALNPVKTIGEQVAEGVRWHTRASRADAEDRARKMLDRVGLPPTKFPLSRYPHELSGGQRQRVVIAIACALKPKLLIADEPTTALDVVLQAQILDLLRDLVAENRMGLLLISHDLAVVTEMADRITILRHGEVMEAGDTARTLSEQLHPYTRQLAQASMHVPARARTHEVGQDTPLLQGAKPLLQVDSVTRDYPGRRPLLLKRAAPIRAVDDVSFSIGPGQSVALVGRSGCGKSTL
ncbi:MAG: ABC transporter ATP-binding protein, partial [Mesorhizobium sp.]